MSAVVPAKALPVTMAAAARAAAWLGKAWTGRDTGDGRLLVEALALSHLCRLLCGNAPEILGEESLAGATNELAWTSANLLTSLIAAVGVLEEGNELGASAKQYLLMLNEIGAEHLDCVNGVLVRLALHESDDRTCTGEPCCATLDPHALQESPSELRRTLADIEMSTAFGIAPIRAEPPVPILMEGAAIAAFRAYDLPLGMRLLRARQYVSDPYPIGTPVGFDFLRLTQRDDGSFGDYDTALAEMAVRGERNASLQIHLPVTLQALWTMAELENPEFRLLRSVFPGPCFKELELVKERR